MSALTIGSLFSGIGGLELGLEWAGLGPVVWQVEQDEYCRAVLAKHWPNATRYEDVRDVGANLAAVDIICGGFPCQDISVAGKGAGLAGERSGLWSEYARIVRELRPSYVVVENVSALLARGLGDVLRDLAAFGYDAWWDCIPALAVGAPHRRDRLFIVAYAERSRLEGSTGARFSGPRRSSGFLAGRSDAVADAQGVGSQGRSHADGKHSTPRGDRRGKSTGGRTGSRTPSALDDAVRRRYGPSQGEVCPGRDGSEHAGWWTTEPDVGRVAHGVPARVDRLRALGNAVVPQVAEIVGQVILERERQLAEQSA